MDGLYASLLLGGAGICAVVALVAAKWLRIDTIMERSASTAIWRLFGRGFAMAGWMMLATVGVVSVGFVPTAWLTSPAGATWFGLTLLGSLSVLAWSRSVLQARAAANTAPAIQPSRDQARRAA